MKKKIIPIIFITLLLASMFCGCDTAGTSGSTAYVGTWIGEIMEDSWVSYVFTDSTYEYIYSTDSEQLNVMEAKKGNLTVYDDVMFHTLTHYWDDKNSDTQISDNEWVEIYSGVQTFSFTIANNTMSFYGLDIDFPVILQLVN